MDGKRRGGKEGEARQNVEQQQRRQQRRGFSAPLLPVAMALCLISFGIGHKHGIASNMIIDDDDSRLSLIQPSSRSATSASTMNNTQTQHNYGLHPNIRNGHTRMAQLSENSSFLVRVPGDTNEDDGTNDYTRQQVGYVRQDVIYGHIHLAKTGGTSLNGILANRYEQICGHKGYSYDAYQSNELAIAKAKEDNVSKISIYYNKGFDIVDHELMQEIGFEDCDYVSEEMDSDFFVSNFGSNKFHNISMELHVPCRDPIDHLMSQCNFFREFLPSRKAGIYWLQ